MDWVTTQFKIYAIVKFTRRSPGSPDFTENKFFDLVRFSCDFELNGIPGAVASVAVGANAENVAELSEIHFVVGKMKQMLPVSVYMKVQPFSTGTPFTERDAWPDPNPDGTPAPFRIFRGYVVGANLRKSTNHAEYVIHMTHWLADLNFSSSVSRSSHATNPSQVSFNAAFPSMDSAGAGSYGPDAANATAETVAKGNFTPDVIIKDFWANLDNSLGLAGWFARLCEMDRIWTSPALLDAVGPQAPDFNTNQNWEAYRALQHFEPYANYNVNYPPQAFQETGYIDGVPLDLDLWGADSAAIFLSDSIGMDVSRESFETSAGFTIWDKLVGQFASQYLFAVVPMVEKALVVPYCPGLKWSSVKGARYFSSQDYDHFEMTTNIPRPLRGIFLMTSMPLSTGGDGNFAGSTNYTSTGPPKYLSTSGVNQGGLIIFKEAPRWMTDLALSFMYPSMDPPFSSNYNTNTGTAGPNPSLDVVQLSISTFWDKYAQALYLQEVTKGRQAVLSGRLRFDTAPGTLVKIQMNDTTTVTDNSVINAPLISDYMYGMVLRVSCTLDAENARAGTSFQIGFLTSQEEQTNSDVTIDRHPIWKSKFYGAPLVVTGNEYVAHDDPFRHWWTPAMAPSVVDP